MNTFQKYGNGMLVNPLNPLIAITPDPSMIAEDELRLEYQQVLLKHGDIGISEEDYISRRKEQIIVDRPGFSVKIINKR